MKTPDDRPDPAAPRVWIATATLVVAASLGIAACGAAAGEADGSTPAGSGGSGTGGSTDGAGLYQSNCASCHGTDLGGTEKGPSHLSIVYEPNHHGDEAFRSAIANGAPQHHWNFGNMSAIEGLDDADVDAIIRYIRSEQERRGFER